MTRPAGPRASVARLFHTVRFLKARQIAAQVHHRARALLERPEAWAARPSPPDPGRRWQPREEFLPPGAQLQRPEDLLAGRFCFLNRPVELGWPPRWSDSALPRLWAYNLHYFEFLWALDYEAAREVTLDWITRHTPARGRVGWEPYPTSLRLQNWCGFFHGRHRERCERDAELREALWPSLHRQAEWLSRHLEWHLLGNHLLENAVALALCGACHGGAPGEAWLATGLRLLRRELPEQILEDGGHFERSPMYQARVAYVLGLLAASGDASLLACVEPARERCLRALAALVHPDGEIALLNDSAFGIANPPAALDLPDPPPGSFALPQTGYYGARSPDGHYLVCDAAPVGPDYLPGHAHADLLGFELSLHGQRAIVDAGVAGYEEDALRAWCRSTRAHNTVEVDGESQCELWGVFRVARRGRPRDVAWQALGGGFRLSAWHDGYERLAGRPRHERRFRWHEQGVLLVRDRVTASRDVDVGVRLHLHPDCEIERVADGTARIRHPAGPFRVVFAGKGRLDVEDSRYCPAFGRSVDNNSLVFASRGSAVESGFCIAAGPGDLRYDLAAGAEGERARYDW